MFQILKLQDKEPPGTEFMRLNTSLISHGCISGTGNESFEVPFAFLLQYKGPGTLSLQIP